MLTYKGRVVYDRKPHMFKITDLERIAKTLGAVVTMRSDKPRWRQLLSEIYKILVETTFLPYAQIYTPALGEVEFDPSAAAAFLAEQSEDSLVLDWRAPLGWTPGFE